MARLVQKNLPKAGYHRSPGPAAGDEDTGDSPRRSNALEHYREHAPSAAMREIARVAVSRGLRQESLAKLLGHQPAAIARHFASKSPHEATVRKYADLLGVEPAYLTLVSDEVISADQATKAHDRLSWSLDRAAPDLVAGAIREFWKYYHRLTPEARKKLLTAVAIANYRAEAAPNTLHYESGWPARIPWLVQELARNIQPDFDLKARLREGGPPTNLLYSIWQSALTFFSPEEAEVLVDVVRAMLRAKNIPYGNLNQYLRQKTERSIDPIPRTRTRTHSGAIRRKQT